jgi:ABC-2 type transport system permease protein
METQANQPKIKGKTSLAKLLSRLPQPEANPIIIKELRSRMRGARAFIILTIVLLLLASFSYLVYRLALAMSSTFNAPVSPQIGQTLLNTLAFIELMIVCLITPAVTAGAISSEREKLTYEMLLSTPLRPTSILWGKLVSALSYVFLLIFAAVPLASLVFTFGGVSLRDMAKALLVLIATTITLGVMGVFLSTWLGRTARATVASYLVVLLLFIAPVVVYVAVAVLSAKAPPRQLLMPSPAGALFSALSTSMPYMGPFSVFGDLGRLIGGNLDIVWGEGRGIPRPIYHYTLPFYGGMTIVLYLLSTRLVQPIRRWRLKLKEVLFALTLLAVYSSGVFLFFRLTSPRYEKATSPAPILGDGGGVGGGGGGVFLSGPMPAFPPTSPAEDAITIQNRLLESEDELGSVYAAAALQLYRGAFPSGEPDVLYLVERNDDALGGITQGLPLQGLPTDAVVSQLKKPVSDALEIVWIKSPADAPNDPKTGVLEKNSAVIQFSTGRIQDDGRILLSVEIRSTNPQGNGLNEVIKTFTLQQVNGEWKVVEQVE